jgi:hypothetical protein
VCLQHAQWCTCPSQHMPHITFFCTIHALPPIIPGAPKKHCLSSTQSPKYARWIFCHSHSTIR